MKALGGRILDFALCVAAAAYLINWAWDKLQPILPGVIILAGLVVLGPAIYRRLRGF